MAAEGLRRINAFLAGHRRSVGFGRSNVRRGGPVRPRLLVRASAGSWHPNVTNFVFAAAAAAAAASFSFFLPFLILGA